MHILYILRLPRVCVWVCFGVVALYPSARVHFIPDRHLNSAESGSTLSHFYVFRVRVWVRGTLCGSDDEINRFFSPHFLPNTHTAHPNKYIIRNCALCFAKQKSKSKFIGQFFGEFKKINIKILFNIFYCFSYENGFELVLYLPAGFPSQYAPAAQRKSRAVQSLCYHTLLVAPLLFSLLVSCEG